MSRNIAKKSSVSLPAEESMLRNTSGGKLLFTDYQSRKSAMLLKGDRLTACSFLEEGSSKIGAVYIGKVKNVAENINACFVEIADREICFLPMKEAAAPLLLNRFFDGRILAGDELPVQVVKDAQKTKQTSVTSRISLSNDYFALELGTDRVNFSSKLGKMQRALLTELLQKCGILDEKEGSRLAQKALLVNPTGIPETITAPVGMVVRTRAGDLLDDADLLAAQFGQLADAFVSLLHTAFHRSCFSCLKKAPEPFEYALKQIAAMDEFDELVTDDAQLYSQLADYAKVHLPGKTVRLYADNALSLESLYSLRTRMKTALSERVWLKSGGYLIIQPTEALTAIDVNSGKYDVRRGSEETALKINLEAAEEIALQLRLRNLSGIIIVDFINMKTEASRQKLLHFLKTAVRKDRLRTIVVDMTPLGLVELTRKKESKPLHEQAAIR